jgi:two pore calcium channel protein
MRWIGIICAFRLLKLFATYPQFQHIVETFTSLVPCVLPFLTVLFCFYYVWAIVGMLAYYGKLDPNNPTLKGTDYDTLNYYCNNFDNYQNALVTLFELMVVNNWQVRVIKKGKKTRIDWIYKTLFGLFFDPTQS